MNMHAAHDGLDDPSWFLCGAPSPSRPGVRAAAGEEGQVTDTLQISVRRAVARPVQNGMHMEPATHRSVVRRRSDGVVQILALRPPVVSDRALRSLALGLVGASLLLATLLATPFWLAWSARHIGQGRDAGSHMLGK